LASISSSTLVYTYTQYDRELLESAIEKREFANQAFYSKNAGCQWTVANFFGSGLELDICF